MKTVFFLSGVFYSVLLFFAVITDPRPGHDFGKQHPFNYDYSYWSLTVSIIGLKKPTITNLIGQIHKNTNSKITLPN